MVNRLRLRKNTRGAAILEMTIVLLLLLWLTVMGSWLIVLLRNVQYITNAARYGARIAVRAEGTVEDVNNAIADLFDTDKANISNYTVRFYRIDEDPNTGDMVDTQITNISVEVGVPITVEITVPHGNLAGYVPIITEADWDVVASNTLTKEGP